MLDQLRCSMSRYRAFVFIFLTVLKTTKAQTLENVAVGKACYDSSTYTGGGISNDCSCAINGNTNTTYTHGNCIHTDVNDTNPTWSVDLGQTYVIQKITVIGRDGGLIIVRMRLRNVVVSVNQKEVFRFPHTLIPDVVTDIDSSSSPGFLPLSGRYVTLSRSAVLPNGTHIDLDEGWVLMNICEVQVWALQACAPYPCQNGGTCLSTSGDVYSCLCVQGYTGTNCQTNINNCASSPCVHGGTCINGVASYDCICLIGYTGRRCESELDDCATSPCANGGTSTEGVASSTGLSGLTEYPCRTEPGQQTAAGSIVGAFFGGVVLTAIVMILGFCFWKRRTIPRNNKGDQKVNTPSVVLHRERQKNLKKETSARPKPGSSDQEGGTVTNTCHVIADNTYEQLHIYNNDGKPKSDVYIGLQITK